MGEKLCTFNGQDIPKGIVKWYVEIFDDTDELAGVATILTMVERKEKQ